MTPSQDAPQLSLVVPAYNEERCIEASMQQIGAYLAAQPFTSEVVVVDDGSAEAGRRAVAEAIAALPACVQGRSIRHPTNYGKGAAVRTGCLAATGRYVAFIDADIATPPSELTLLLEALEAGADLAIGIRNQRDGSDMRDRRGLARRLAGRAYTMAMRLLLLPDIEDSQCPLKAFRREVAHNLFRRQVINTWAFDAEILFLARRGGYRLATVPVVWRAVEGSHLQLNRRTALEALNLLRIRWLHRGWKLGQQPSPPST
jgi:dolichyl-phosphate beta-glucosyltransferase